MDGVSSVANAVEAVGRVLETASRAEIEMAEKLMKVSVEVNVGRAVGKGENLDQTA
jgi:hypothetical protein